MADKSNSSGDKDKTTNELVNERNMKSKKGGWTNKDGVDGFDFQNLERNPRFSALKSGGGWKREKTYKGRGGTR